MVGRYIGGTTSLIFRRRGGTTSLTSLTAFGLSPVVASARDAHLQPRLGTLLVVGLQPLCPAWGACLAPLSGLALAILLLSPLAAALFPAFFIKVECADPPDAQPVPCVGVEQEPLANLVAGDLAFHYCPVRRLPRLVGRHPGRPKRDGVEHRFFAPVRPVALRFDAQEGEQVFVAGIIVGDDEPLPTVAVVEHRSDFTGPDAVDGAPVDRLLGHGPACFC